VECRNTTFLSKEFPVFWESAHGSTVRDLDGHAYLDLTSAFGVSSLGHSDPGVQKAIHEQTSKMWHGMGDVHPNAVKVELLEMLADLAPGRLQKSILSSSGAEAVEAALKTARLFTGKSGVIAFKGAYHGLSLGTLAATSRKDFRQPFKGQIPGFVVHLPFPDSLRGPSEDACLRRVEEEFRKKRPVGAVLVEPMQGRGGIHIPHPSFVTKLAEITRSHHALFIADEIFTGFGRTGKMFGVVHSGVAPDLMTVGKALANGFPLSACIGTARVMDAWPVSDGEAIHTSTFLGNPLGCAMGKASLKALKKMNLVKRSAVLGRAWKKDLSAALADHPNVGDIRGLGLMCGIELVRDKLSNEPHPQLAARVVTRALQHGLLILSGGTFRNVLTLTPPLTISAEALGRATQILKEVLNGTTFRAH
jgi:4-aminobutyrate aminotransferase / (S)-3-amino-2-methylpropionate transaminase / 5-aminovalerate transaminase